MKLIQLNLWGGKLEHQLDDFFNAEMPDIICMQEVHQMSGPSGAVFRTLDEITERGNYEHSFMAPTYTSHYQNRELSFGNAIVSRYSIQTKDTIFTYGSYKSSFDLLEDDFNVRNLQIAAIETPHGTITILNHHGWLIEGSKQGDAETVRQMHIIAEEIKSRTGPLIVTGDFNLVPESDSIAVLNGLLRNLSLENGLKSTYNEFNSNKTVSDYIFVSEDITVNAFSLSDALVSDHKALVLDFDV